MNRFPSFLFLLLLAMLFAIQPLEAQNQITRIEPPSWWVGMKNPEVQLLIYGEDISNLQPSIDYPGVYLQQVHRVENPNYLFVDLVIEEKAVPGTLRIEFRKAGQVVETHDYPLQARREGSAEREGFNPSDVMYLITPDRFVNGNPGNDNVAGMQEKANRGFIGGRHGGDIKGILDHLDYIDDLGFTAIWVNPVLENDQPEYSYHGYSTTDFYKVDPRFGSNEEYRQLAQAAKDRGIKMIMDMIVNHCGSEHWWVKDPPTPDWINFGGEFVQTNHRKATLQDPHRSEIDHKHFVDGWFVSTMPDLNQRNDFMATYLTQNSIWWVEYADLAGIRMDTYPYPDTDYMAEWAEKVMAEYPNFNIVGEEWVGNPAMVSYWQKGKVNPNGFTSELPSLMDFPVQETMVRALNGEEKQYGSGLILLYEMLANDFLYPDPYNLVVFPDNHDMDRFFAQVNENLDLFKLGMVFTLTTRGIPQVYYGTEVLLAGNGDHGRIREDFPGGWAGDKVNAFTGKGLTAQQQEALAFTKKLLNWRKRSLPIHRGKLMHYIPENGVYVYFRYDGDNKVMVVLNKSDQERTLELGRFSEMLHDKKQGREVFSGKVIPLTKALTVPARTPMVLELE